MTRSEEHDQQEESSLESFETEENQNVTIDSFDVKDESGGLESDPVQTLGEMEYRVCTSSVKSPASNFSSLLMAP